MKEYAQYLSLVYFVYITTQFVSFKIQYSTFIYTENAYFINN